ncbi:MULTISPECIES: hypothetical protein [unclassified Pseudomonas]|uniref:hypothetical protein n=1 Tax=unclassified Pseudomonas TaxID=196821 RepID=UPI0011ED44D7|nr:MULTISPECIES: hypothetical protein [unclassified Pseudomonas]KAA0942338.1 hypothetical protein FQ182_27795 [Pseudomonas sp. ANT_H4]KAA0947604.1 hypothetical protein FQ186_25230 [Pseudomonas sp. ANT_H14]
MPLNKRDHARIERRLIATLTEACEIAKAEISGFDWLTHKVDYQAFSQSLRVIWVFDTRTNKEQALSAGRDARMRELTAMALSEADVEVSQLERCVRFDSEEECQINHAGDWRRRLAQLCAVRGKVLAKDIENP